MVPGPPLTQLIDARVQQLLADRPNDPHLDLALRDVERRLRARTQHALQSRRQGANCSVFQLDAAVRSSGGWLIS